MFSIVEIMGYVVGICGIWFGFSAWRKSDNQDAARLGVIETKLENILDDLKSLIGKIDRSDEKFNVIDTKLAKLEEQVKTCFTMIKKGENR